jgi:hypothetical protein
VLGLQYRYSELNIGRLDLRGSGWFSLWVSKTTKREFNRIRCFHSEVNAEASARARGSSNANIDRQLQAALVNVLVTPVLSCSVVTSVTF